MRSLINMISNARGKGIFIENPVVDGKYHRCRTADKPNKRNGWYRVFTNPFYATFGNWATGEKHRMTEPGEIRSEVWADMQKRIKERSSLNKLKQEEQQAKVALKANLIYTKSSGVTQHPYLSKKGFDYIRGVKRAFTDLVVPLWNLECETPNELKIQNLQFIGLNSNKRFLKNGKVKSCAFLIWPESRQVNHIYLCEGVATAATLHQLSDNLVIAAMNANNLENIAKLSQRLWPDSQITICGDDDYLTELRTGNNPGKEAALKAASFTGGITSFPPLTFDQKEQGLTDWNDWQNALRGNQHEQG